MLVAGARLAAGSTVLMRNLLPRSPLRSPGWKPEISATIETSEMESGNAGFTAALGTGSIWGLTGTR